MIDITGKDLDLNDLEKKLDAAGVFHNALGTSDNLLYTYDDEGEIAPLAEAAKAVVAAYRKPAALPQPDIDADIPTDRTVLLNAIKAMQTFVRTTNGNANTTNNAVAIKAIIVVLLWLLKRVTGGRI